MPLDITFESDWDQDSVVHNRVYLNHDSYRSKNEVERLVESAASSNFAPAAFSLQQIRVIKGIHQRVDRDHAHQAHITVRIGGVGYHINLVPSEWKSDSSFVWKVDSITK